MPASDVVDLIGRCGSLAIWEVMPPPARTAPIVARQQLCRCFAAIELRMVIYRGTFGPP